MNLTHEQEAAIAACDSTLQAAGLPTYSRLEDELAKAYLATFSSIELGKKLVKQVEVLERKVKKG